MKLLKKKISVNKFLKAGVIYDVYAIYFSKKIEFMVLSHVHSFPVSIDLDDVEVIDNRLSKSWVYGMPESDSVVLSFPDWANDSYFYQNLIEGKGSAGDIFRSYENKIECEYADPNLTLSASILKDNWVQCPKCMEGWEVRDYMEVITCPKCESKLLNPLK